MNDHFEQLAEALRAEADRSGFTDLTEPAVAKGTRRRRVGWMRTRAATATAALLFGLGSFGGLAYTASGASGNGFHRIEFADHLAEVQALVGQGHAADAIAHVVDTILGTSEDLDEARDALLAAADRVTDATEPEGLDDLLTYLAGSIGAVDGPTVAELAKQIGPNSNGVPDGVPGDPPIPTDPPNDTPDSDPEGPPDEVPGPPDEVPGPPETPSP